MTPRRILVVVYPFPPMPSVGGNRWAATATYLRRLGHEVTVLTTSAYGALPDGDERHVVRTADLNAAPRLRALLRRPALPAADGAASGTEKPPPSLLTRVIVPDAFAASWVPAALRTARRILRERPIDCLVTSSPFESTHLVGLGLGRARPAWLADFRDGWRFEDLREPFPTGPQRALDRTLERRVVQGADAVVAATPPIAEDLAARLGAPAVHIPNGWDPDLDAAVGAATPPPREPGCVTLVHTGALSGGSGRSPRALFAALRELASSDPAFAARTRLVLAGRLSPDEQAAIAAPPLDGIVRHVGQLTRPQAAALQRQADALVLLTSRQRSEATGKLFEYLAAGRPILALAEGNVAAEVIHETGTGVTVAPDDVAAIAAALARAAREDLVGSYRPQGLERYIFPGPAEAIADQVELAIERRGARG